MIGGFDARSLRGLYFYFLKGVVRMYTRRLTDNETYVHDNDVRSIAIGTGINVVGLYDYLHSVPDMCRYCSNHPSNGGSGICHCTLGTPKIT